MNTPKSDYMLLFRGTHWDDGITPEEAQKTVADFMAWFERLRAQGKAIAGSPLTNEGKIVSGKNKTVADGPFAESKEAIGGYFLLQVADLDEAVEIAKGCPALAYGLKVEVRQIADECAMKSRLDQQIAAATA